ncbi:MAG: tetratricopeptide repeat protein, partial [Pseudomonadota bacterium]
SALTLVPTLSITLYLVLGTPPDSVREEPRGAQLEEQTLEQLVLTAERRLESEPDDLQGWQVLAPVYLRQNDLDRAENALRNIIRLNGANSLTFSTLGEILVSRTNGEVRREALQLFRDAAKQDKQNATARYYLGLSALQNGDLDEARQTWQAMLNDANGDEEWLPSIRQRLASLEEATAEPAPPLSAQEEILQLSGEEQRARIEGMVETLADRLADNPDDQDGWQRLVTAYKVLGMDERAESAVLAATRAHREDEAFLESLSLILENRKPMDTLQ